MAWDQMFTSSLETLNIDRTHSILDSEKRYPRVMYGFTRHGWGRSSYLIKPCSCARLIACSMLSFRLPLARRAFSRLSSTTSLAFPKPSSAIRHPSSMISEIPESRTACARASSSNRNPSINRIPACAFDSKLSRVAHTFL